MTAGPGSAPGGTPSDLAAHPRPPRVVVAIATYRRPADLRACLRAVGDDLARSLARSLDRSIAPAGATAPSVRIVVVDNDPDGSARTVTAEFGDLVTYVAEPTPGISAARNAALDRAADDDVLVFIDDDETPEPGWLDALLGTYASARAHAVAGRVLSAFEAPLDPWIDAGGFFRRRSLPTGTRIDVAATNNLLLDLAFVRAAGLRFDPAYGLTGGGDHDFTRRMIRAGAVMVWCNEAVVIDHVPPDRATRTWVSRRARRTANSEFVVALAHASGPADRVRVRVRALLRGGVRLAAGWVGIAAGRLTRDLSLQARGAKAVHRGHGMLDAARGRTVAEYLREPSTSLRLLTSFPAPGATTNPYIRQLAAALDGTPELRMSTFGWRQALLGRHDVVHLHWPEIMPGGASRPKRAVRTALFAILVARWTLGRVAVVRTVHNTTPHETQRRLVRLLLARLDAAVDARIVLNPIDLRTPSDTLVPHGHYIDWFAGHARSTPVPGRLVFAGLVRAYKNPVALVDAFAGVTRDPASLRIAGRPADPDLAAELTARAERDPRVSLRLTHLDDAELVAEITAAQAVVLPYREMGNSGLALLALSLERPVVVPDNAVNRALADEVGPAWVRLFPAPLTAARLDEVLREVAQPVAGRPDLSARSWDDAGARHLDVYRTAVDRRRRRRRS